MAMGGGAAAAMRPKSSQEPKDQYLQQPELLRETWRTASQIVSGMLLDDLTKKK
jgi:hypothetical protein